MTEADWNRCSRPQAMLDFLQGKASDRKLRLFTCAYCRYIVQENQAVQVAERFADGLVTNAECKHARTEAVKAATRSRGAGWGGINDLMAVQALAIARILCPPGRTYRECGTLPGTVVHAVRVVNPQASDELQQAQVMLLRDIFGNPFRPTPAVDLAWLAWNDGTVKHLAEAAYENRVMPAGMLENARLAVLADALEEASCTDASLLAHLRSPGSHVRGCFALDAVLGKS
jgi:hypothetical protein